MIREIQAKANKFNFKTNEDKNEWIEEKVTESIAELVTTLVDSTNTSIYKDAIQKGIVQGLTKSHRFLQEEFIKLLVNSLEEYGNNNLFDGRNQYSIELCKQIAIVKNSYLTTKELKEKLK